MDISIHILSVFDHTTLPRHHLEHPMWPDFELRCPNLDLDFARCNRASAYFRFLNAEVNCGARAKDGNVEADVVRNDDWLAAR